MKIRWTRGSLRLRISPPELERLLGGDATTETLTLPGGGGWSATLAAGDETALRRTENNGLCVTLSPADRTLLAAPDREGVYFATAAAEDGDVPPLRYYVEKDFPCAHPGAPEAREPTTETFAPPPGFKERHRGVECG